MLNTKLILIEGMPGAGKTTTTIFLGALLRQRGVSCRWFLEDDDPHPIACLDFEIEELLQKMLPLWKNFSRDAEGAPTITIMESRLWQNTAFFMYLSECGLEEIHEFNMQVGKALSPLLPALVYLDQDNAENALRRLYAMRGEKWMDWMLGVFSEYRWFQRRGCRDLEGLVGFFEEWRQVALRLHEAWPYYKIRIRNPHEDWAGAYQQIEAFLFNVKG